MVDIGRRDGEGVRVKGDANGLYGVPHGRSQFKINNCKRVVSTQHFCPPQRYPTQERAPLHYILPCRAPGTRQRLQLASSSDLQCPDVPDNRIQSLFFDSSISLQFSYFRSQCLLPPTSRKSSHGNSSVMCTNELGLGTPCCDTLGVKLETSIRIRLCHHLPLLSFMPFVSASPIMYHGFWTSKAPCDRW